jgi:hypothetical protein
MVKVGWFGLSLDLICLDARQHLLILKEVSKAIVEQSNNRKGTLGIVDLLHLTAMDFVTGNTYDTNVSLRHLSPHGHSAKHLSFLMW